MPDSTTIISRLSTRFSNATTDREQPDMLTRDIGGHFRTNHPYVNGYFQVVFGLPKALFNNTGTEAASKFLHAACEGFTPHTQMLNKVDLMGQGQLGSSFVTSVMTTREFTLTFREYQNMPILNVIKQWTSVFDPFTGVSPLSGSQFIPLNYKGWVAVIQTKPVGSRDADIELADVEECYVYQGVFPTNIPIDTASSSDIATNDMVQHNVTFSFDGAPMTSAEPGITAKCVELLKDLRYIGAGSSGSTYGRFHDSAKNLAQWGSHDGSTSSTPSV